MVQLLHIKYINLYKPNIIFVADRQTVQTQIRRHKTRRLVSVSTGCLQKTVFKFK